MVGITRCSPLRLLSSFVLLLLISVSVYVFTIRSGTATKVGIDFYHDTTSNLPVQHVDKNLLGDDHQHGVQHFVLTNNDKLDIPFLLSQDIEGLETFVIFIGYPRSSHSIIGSMIDAHPNAIIAHEFSLFAKVVSEPSYRSLLESKVNLINSLYINSYGHSVRGWRSNNTNFANKGYTLKMNSTESWQGRFSSLKVIGDKSGATTTRTYRDNPHKFKAAFNSLVNVLKIPIKAIHVIRNPFDMIATRLLYHYSETRGRKGNFTKTHKLNGTYVYHPVERIHTEAQAVNDMIREFNLTVFEIHNADFVHDTKRWMQKLCDFLGLECSQSYLEMCDEKTFKTMSRTRYNVEWEDETRHSVENMIKEFPFFHRYSFDSD